MPRLLGKGKLAGRQGRHDQRRLSSRPSTSSSRPARAPANSRAWSPTASWSGPIARRWCPKSMPKSLLVIGSGAIGIEFASFYRDMGAEVTVVEMLDRILPVEDEEISAFARKAFEKQGMKILHRRQGREAREGRGRRHRDDRGRRQDRDDQGRSRHPRRRHRRQCREHRPRRHQGRRSRRPTSSSTSGCDDRRARHLCHRRRRRPALAGPQGEPRRRHLRRAHRRHQGVIRSTSPTSRAAPIATRRSPASA